MFCLVKLRGEILNGRGGVFRVDHLPSLAYVFLVLGGLFFLVRLVRVMMAFAKS